MGHTLTSIIGRKEELQLLHDIYESDVPEFLALYGRRRIGNSVEF